MEKRPYISAKAFFKSLPPERQAKILREAEEIIADNRSARQAKKVAGLETSRQVKTSKPMPVAK